jgi:hypothetical protein
MALGRVAIMRSTSLSEFRDMAEELAERQAIM